MNDLEQNEQMELMERIAATQPGVLSPSQKMQLGIWRSSQKRATNGLSTDELLQLRGLKKSIATDILTPNERTIMALEIQNFEKKMGENK
jgi:hypothetical protein